MTTPADKLRAAAEKLRKLTGQAIEGPWTATWSEQQYELKGPSSVDPIAEWTYAIATWEPKASEQRAECDTADADYIAAMHPGVGLALADWLESEAEFGADPGIGPAALTVARLINGSAS